MNEHEEYAQYLKETGQGGGAEAFSAPKYPTPLSDSGRVHQMIEESTFTPDQIKAAIQGRLGIMGGGGLSEGVAKKLAGGLGESLSSIAGNAVEGGALNAVQGPNEDMLKNFLTGAGTQGGMTTLGKSMGKIGDVSMQLGVGRKKYTNGVGTELADQGLFGTRGMMRNQTENKLTDAYEQMRRAAEGAGPIDATRIAETLRNEASGPLTGRGTLMASSRDVPAINQINEFADDIAGRGTESAVQGLGRRRAAGSSAYSMKSGEPKQNQLSQLSKLEQREYSNAVKAADPTGKLAEADSTYAALKRAQRGLAEEPSLTGLGLLSRPVSAVGAAPLATAIGQGGVKGGRLAEFLAPIARQGVANASHNDPKTGDPEYQQYMQYLKETGQ